MKLTPPVPAGAPLGGPKFAPRTVTTVPTAPKAGLTVPMDGPAIPEPVTLNPAPLLPCPLTVTTTGPLEAPGGTGARISVPLQ